MKIKVKIDKYVCERCDYIWESRISTTPKFCPNCKSEYWNKPRQIKKRNEIKNG